MKKEPKLYFIFISNQSVPFAVTYVVRISRLSNTTMEGKITTTNSESCTWWPFVFDLIVVKKIRKFHTHTMISVMTCAVLLLCIFFFPLFSVLLLATYFTFFCVSALFYVLPMFYFFYF